MGRILFLVYISLLSCFTLSSQRLDALLPSHAHVIHHNYYSLEYSEHHEQALWVFYELTRLEAQGGYERTNNFREDPMINTGSARLSDYKGYGFDRGHLAPAGDMAFSKIAMSESFYMSNMSPQEPGFNRGIWRKLEAQFRNWAVEDGELYIVTGPIFSKGNQRFIGSRVSIPDYYFKIGLDLDSGELRSIAFILPNSSSSRSLKSYEVSIDSIENLTSIDFFPGLGDSIESYLESQTIGPWIYSLTNQSISKENRSPGTQCFGITQQGVRCKRITKSGSNLCWQHDSNYQNKPKTTPNAPTSYSTSVRCNGITQSGNRCKRMTKNSSGYCWQHEK